MTDADARLKAMFEADIPPTTDARFRLEVLERIERRSARRRLAIVLGAGAVATAGAATLGPQLTASLGGGAMVAIGLVIAGVATLWGMMQMHSPI